MNFGPWELIIILVILLLLFGSTRLPQLAKGMGKSIREFKRGINDNEEEAAQLDAAPPRERLRGSDSDRLRDEELARDRPVTTDRR